MAKLVSTRMRALLRRRGAVARNFGSDRRGASMMQFMAIIPVLLLFVVGTWSMYIVYSAHQTLCEATWEAARYLQVEGPMFGDKYPYPTGYEEVATEIINTTLRDNALSPMQVTQGDVRVFPQAGVQDHPQPPSDPSEVNERTVENAWFFVRATSSVTHPLSWLFRVAGETGALALQCQSTAFYEDKPLGPSVQPGATNCPECDNLPVCTAGIPEPPEERPPCPPCSLAGGKCPW